MASLGSRLPDPAGGDTKVLGVQVEEGVNSIGMPKKRRRIAPTLLSVDDNSLNSEAGLLPFGSSPPDIGTGPTSTPSDDTGVNASSSSGGSGRYLLEQTLEGMETLGVTTRPQRARMTREQLETRGLEIQREQLVIDVQYADVLGNPERCDELDVLDARCDALAEEADQIEALLGRKFKVTGGGRFLLHPAVQQAFGLGRSLGHDVSLHRGLGTTGGALGSDSIMEIVASDSDSENNPQVGDAQPAPAPGKIPNGKRERKARRGLTRAEVNQRLDQEQREIAARRKERKQVREAGILGELQAEVERKQNRPVSRRRRNKRKRPAGSFRAKPRPVYPHVLGTVSVAVDITNQPNWSAIGAVLVPRQDPASGSTRLAAVGPREEVIAFASGEYDNERTLTGALVLLRDRGIIGPLSCAPHSDDAAVVIVEVRLTVDAFTKYLLRNTALRTAMATLLRAFRGAVEHTVKPMAGGVNVASLYESLRPTPQWKGGEVDNPHELRSMLLPFQRKAVAWMLEREQGAKGRTLSNLLWSIADFTAPSGPKRVWFSRWTGALYSDTSPPPDDHIDAIPDVSGGILAEEMGLGKTVETISLILLHPQPLAARHPTQDSFGLSSPNRQRPPVGCTLVVTPRSIMHQWKREIGIHAPHLRVAIYSSRKDVGDIEPVDFFRDYDVVLASYATLSAEVDFSKETPHNLRKRKRYTIPKSPILEVRWWRCVLDEAQEVESTVTRCAQMASRIEAVHRWCVTGTPIGKRGLEDLYGLMLFLRLRPFNDAGCWRWCVQTPFEEGEGRALISLLRTMLWRHSKRHIQSELQLPELREEVVDIKLSAVERAHYDRVFRRVQNVVFSESKQDGISDGDAVSRLEPLRVACCIPAAATPGGNRVMTLATYGQVMCHEARVRKQDAEKGLCRALVSLAGFYMANNDRIRAFKPLVRAWNIIDKGIGVSDDDTELRVSAKFANATDEVRSWQLIEFVTTHHLEMIFLWGLFQDTCEPLGDVSTGAALLGAERHAVDVSLRFPPSGMNSRGDVLGPVRIPAAISPRDKPREFEQLFFKMLSRSFCVEKTDIKHITFAEARQGGVEPGVAKVWKVFVHLAATDAKAKFLNLLKAPWTRMGGAMSDRDAWIARQGASAQKNARLAAQMARESNTKRRELLFLQEESVSTIQSYIVDYNRELKQFAEASTDTEASSIALKLIELGHREFKARGHMVRLEAINKRIVRSRASVNRMFRLFDHRLKLIQLTDFIAAFGQDRNRVALVKARAMMEIKGRGSKTNTFHETPQMSVDRMSTYLKRAHRQMKVKDDTLASKIDAEHIHTDFNDRAQHARCRAQWNRVTDDISMLRMCRHVVVTQGGAQLRHEMELMRQKKNLEELINESLNVQGKNATALEAHAQAKYAKAMSSKGHLEFLMNNFGTEAGAENEGKEDHKHEGECPICKHQIRNRAATPCGHEFCFDCIRTALVKRAGRKMVCPICRTKTTLADLTIITQESKLSSTTLPQGVKDVQMKGQGDYGAKVETVVKYILSLGVTEPGAKSLVFSRFSGPLDLLAAALERNGIGYEQLKGSAKARSDQVGRFLKHPKTRVLLVSLRTDASGLTLVQATHVFLLEPSFSAAIEAQAINRIHRIGQTKPCFVHRLVTRGTIEEQIFNRVAARSDSASPGPAAASSSRDPLSTMNGGRRKVGGGLAQKSEEKLKVSQLLHILNIIKDPSDF